MDNDFLDYMGGGELTRVGYVICERSLTIKLNAPYTN